MDLNLLQPKVEKILAEMGFRLSNMRFLTEDGDRYLRVIVDKYHHNINLDEIVIISEKIDALLEEDNEAFILDVTTTGAEKEIFGNEIADYVTTYISVALNDAIKGPPIVKGTLLEVSESNLVLSVNEKGRIKKITIPREDIKELRRAVKI